MKLYKSYNVPVTGDKNDKVPAQVNKKPSFETVSEIKMDETDFDSFTMCLKETDR